MPPIDATDFGYVSILRDEPDVSNLTYLKIGGYCVHGIATSTMNPGDVVIVDPAADDSYKTTTSANSTAVAGYVLASLGALGGEGMQWDFDSAIASGDRILILIKGVVLARASTAILRGARVGSSTTAGQVVTTTTQDAAKGIALQAATTQGDRIRVLV